MDDLTHVFAMEQTKTMLVQVGALMLKTTDFRTAEKQAAVIEQGKKLLRALEDAR